MSTELFEVKNRWTGAVAFTATIETTPEMTRGWKLRLAVAWALANATPCAALDLSGADFTGYQCPVFSSFVDSSFVGSSFVDSSFEGSSFVGSIFEGSSFVDSSFEGSSFVGSIFVDSRFEGEPLTRDPICLAGLRWSVTITDAHMQIGCQMHRLTEWAAFDAPTIARMDVRNASAFWKTYKEPLLTMAKANGSVISPPSTEI